MVYRLNKLEKLALILLFILFSFSLIGLFWTPYNPYEVNMNKILLAPSTVHWLGTDALGRDIFSRLMVGGSISIGIGTSIAFLCIMIGAIIGIIGGYYGGIFDELLQMIVSVLQSIPGFSLMLALTGILSPGIFSMVVALIFTGWVSISRIVRSETIKYKEKTYILGAKALGARNKYIIWKYLRREFLPLLLTLFIIRVGATVLAMAGLSFLGLGIQPPYADWGSMISEGRTYFRSAAVMLWAPMGCITLFCLCMAILNEGLKKYDESKKRY